MAYQAAAFAWLCVETSHISFAISTCSRQPPSRGCVLKPYTTALGCNMFSQPPSRGCVLKQRLKYTPVQNQKQPPSRGCVLKQHYHQLYKQEIGSSRLHAAVC